MTSYEEKSHKSIVVVVVCVALVVIFATAWLFSDRLLPLGNTRGTEYDIGQSSKFSQRQLRDASDLAQESFRTQYRGCSLKKLSFHEDQTRATLALYRQDGKGDGISSIGQALEHYGLDNIIVIKVTYSCGRFVPSYLNPYQSDTEEDFLVYHDSRWECM